MTWIDPDDTPSNPTDNPTFSSLVEKAVSRRKVLAGGAATAALTILSGVGTATAKPGRGNGTPAAPGRQGRTRAGLLGFDGYDPADPELRSPTSQVLGAAGYTFDVLAPWGDPVSAGGPAFDDVQGVRPGTQAEQLGMGHDGMEYFPIRNSSTHGLLAINHEYTIRDQMFPLEWYDEAGTFGIADAFLADAVQAEQEAHGISVVEVKRSRDGVWEVVDTLGLGRRVTTYTEMEISGPAAGDDLLKWGGRDGTTTDGTANNCSSGQTPWGTYVTCEENFNGYFWVAEDNDLTEDQQALLDRYGFSAFGFGYPWGAIDERWQAEADVGRTNTYGWNVEIDPFDPDSTPVKRTAMGRFKHEGATFTEGRGRRVVCYMGDDERFDYLYKYVSEGNWKSMFARGRHPLDHGTLYVARFEDGTGEWIPLVHGTGPLTAANGFASQAEVLVKTRLAADAVGATKMDRPEWTAVHPQTGEVFVTLTNNSRRAEGNVANPLTPNFDGHIIGIREDGGDNAATTFTWDFFLFGGDGSPLPGVDERYVVPQDAAFGSPDGLGFDQDGRLWIQTDGGQPLGLNDQMLAADPATREIKRFLVGPDGCEVTGLTFTPDGRTAFVNIQHPNDGASASDIEAGGLDVFPRTGNRPRPATIVIQKVDGGVIGS